MSGKTLDDAQASVLNFLNEARFCAENQKGFAAMCTVFPVILSVSEALDQSPDVKQLIQQFIGHMIDKKKWWFSLPEEVIPITNDVLATRLYDLRNGLAHALSHSGDVILVTKIDEVKMYAELPSDKWFIGITEFVEAVYETVTSLIEANPSLTFDPNPRGVIRNPSEGVITRWGASASGINLKKDFSPSPENWSRKIP